MRLHSSDSAVCSLRRRTRILSKRFFSRVRVTRVRNPSLAKRKNAPAATPTPQRMRCLLMDRPYTKQLQAGIGGLFPELFFDAQQLIVLADSVRAAGGPGLNLSGI